MNEKGLFAEALERFTKVYAEANKLDVREPTAVTLATADAHGRPSSRTILLKSFDERGFVFYTNLRSRKGRQLAENPHAALTFFWQSLMEQVIVEGSVEDIAAEEADAYWVTRPRESQIGAWASEQSETLESREMLTRRYAQFANEHSGSPIPRPPHWSGLRLVPVRIEFWSSQLYRLHDRILYEKLGGEWKRRMLYP